MPEGQKGELKMKKSFVFVYSDGTEEVVEYDSSMYTEEDVRTIYSNMDKFYSSFAVSDWKQLQAPLRNPVVAETPKGVTVNRPTRSDDGRAERK